MYITQAGGTLRQLVKLFTHKTRPLLDEGPRSLISLMQLHFHALSFSISLGIFQHTHTHMQIASHSNFMANLFYGFSRLSSLVLFFWLFRALFMLWLQIFYAFNSFSRHSLCIFQIFAYLAFEMLLLHYYYYYYHYHCGLCKKSRPRNNWEELHFVCIKFIEYFGAANSIVIFLWINNRVLMKKTRIELGQIKGNSD